MKRFILLIFSLLFLFIFNPLPEVSAQEIDVSHYEIDVSDYQIQSDHQVQVNSTASVDVATYDTRMYVSPQTQRISHISQTENGFSSGYGYINMPSRGSAQLTYHTISDEGWSRTTVRQSVGNTWRIQHFNW